MQLGADQIAGVEVPHHGGEHVQPRAGQGHVAQHVPGGAPYIQPQGHAHAGEVVDGHRLQRQCAQANSAGQPVDAKLPRNTLRRPRNTSQIIAKCAAPHAWPGHVGRPCSAACRRGSQYSYYTDEE